MERRLAGLNARIQESGLHIRGGFHVGDQDELTLAGTDKATLLLVGQLGPSLEGLFRSSQIARETEHPLDAWTAALIEPLAVDYGGRALFPFSGPPYHPFEAWALRAGGVYRSPLGLLIHPKYGLWHAYRAALLLPGHWPVDQAPSEHPCEQCQERPCLSACPVMAFTGVRYEVKKCRAHLASTEAACMDHGCESRRACPVGARFHYGAFQTRFHMQAFRTGP